MFLAFTVHDSVLITSLQDELNVLKIGVKDEMDKFPDLVTNIKDLKKKKELETLMSEYDEGTKINNPGFRWAS